MYSDIEWVIVDSFDEFVAGIRKNGPTLIAFIANNIVYYHEAENILNVLAKIENGIKYINNKRL